MKDKKKPEGIVLNEEQVINLIQFIEDVGIFGVQEEE